MRARSFLLQYQKQERIIQSRLEQIACLKEMAEGCTAPIGGDRVQSSGVSRKLENTVVKYADMEQELARDIEEAQRRKTEILEQIEELPPKQYEVLYLLYIENKMLKVVEIEMGKSHSWVTSMHRKGLINLQALLDERGAACEENQ